jgi:hypothetical protein
MARAAALASTLVILAVIVIAGAAGGIIAAVFGSDPQAEASQAALEDIPPDYLALYQHAANLCPGLDWATLAAIGKVESDHGRSPLPGINSGENEAGAAGPMQFLAGTWSDVRAAHSDVGPNKYNPSHAIPGAAHYLCDSGARNGRDLKGAIFTYNNADWYVRDVLHQANEYREKHPEHGDRNTDWDTQQPEYNGPGGKITPRMSSLLRDIQVYGPSGNGITCVAERPSNPSSDHPHGRACDIFFDPDDKQSVADGWTLANRLTENHHLTGVKYVIWQGKFLSAENPEWVPYQSGAYGCPNPNNVTGCHYDHVHVSVY